MNKKIAALALLLLPLTSVAAVVKTGNIITQTTGTYALDWLELTATRGLSYETVSSQFDVGGQFEGWRYATRSEAQRLFGGLPIFTLAYQEISEYPDWYSASGAFRNDFGEVLLGPPPIYVNVAGAMGRVADETSPGFHGYLGVVHTRDARMSIYTDLSFCCEIGDLETRGGSYLVREVAPVPLPAAAWLLLSGLGAIGVVARRRLAAGGQA